MKVLIINAGSSSLKYQLMDSKTNDVIAKGLCERIGMNGSVISYKSNTGKSFKKESEMNDHTDAVKLVLDALVNKESGVLKSMDEIDAVGHRVVHGGELFNSSVLITDEVIKAIEKLSELAPLHNPANIMGILATKKIMKDKPMVAVFDTAFHQTMPKEAFLYGVPYEAYTDYKVRRYGFHGTSHFYVSRRAIEILGNNNAKIITCHLGNGSSITAVNAGKSIDTSMGFTPLEGVVMGTRCGDMDPAVVTYLMNKLDLDPKGMDAYMNKNSGAYGISGVSNDFRDLAAAAASGNERAEIALSMFAYRVKKYIGSYAAAMNGVDAIVFTAGIGENDAGTRARILTDMDYLGIDVDFDRNESCPRGEEIEISKPGSRVKVFVIPTDEEKVIAQDTVRLCK
ncbi:MAG: acetate kinase [Clostridia bacterium]